MEFHTEDGQVVNVCEKNYLSVQPVIEITYGNGWPDGSGSIQLTINDLKKMIELLEEEQ